MVAASLAAPALSSAGRQAASGSGSSSGTSNGTSNGTSSGSSNGSSNGSSSGSSGGSSSGGSSGDGSGGPHGSASPRPSPDVSSYRVIPAVGTVLYVSLRNLPPFVLLSCILGALGVELDEPLGRDPAAAVNRACAHVTVHRLPDRSGPFSDPPRRVRVDEVHLRITVDRAQHVVVDPSLPDEQQNRLLLTLLAAALIVIAALALALVRRRRAP